MKKTFQNVPYVGARTQKNAIRIFIWLTLLGPFTAYTQNQEDLGKEEQAVLAVISEQTRSYFERDFEAWEKTHVQKEYYREFKYWDGWADPVHTVHGWTENLSNRKGRFDPEKPKTKWNSAKYVRSDINIRISQSGDMAWATYTQQAIDSETKAVIGKSYETRVLEKHDGRWRIAYLGYHYLPEETSQAKN